MISLFQSARSKESASRFAQSFQQLPKPRKVILGESGRTQIFSALFVFLIFCLIGLLGGHDNWKSGDFFAVLFYCAFPIFAGGMIVREVYREYLNRKLLAIGQCCTGFVTSQRKAGPRGAQNIIEYGFSDQSGRSGVGSRYDLTLRYAEDMAVPVFYDPDLPSRNVAVCCTIWRIDADVLRENVTVQDSSL